MLALGLAGLLKLPVSLLQRLVDIKFQACIWHNPKEGRPNAPATNPQKSGVTVRPDQASIPVETEKRQRWQVDFQAQQEQHSDVRESGKMPH